RAPKMASAALNEWTPGFDAPKAPKTQDPAVGSTTSTELLQNSSVTPNPDADILSFSVENGDPDRAVRLANGYAAAYVYIRNSRDQAAYQAAQDGIDAQIAKLPKGQAELALQLQEQSAQFGLYAKLAGSNAELTQTATDATKIRPTPLKAGLIGGV